jgi:hypothetical protein
MQIARRANSSKARSLAISENQKYISVRSATFKRGVRVVTNVERNAVDAKGAERRAAGFADGEVVWSWRAHAGAKFRAK